MKQTNKKENTYNEVKNISNILSHLKDYGLDIIAFAKRVHTVLRLFSEYD